MKLFYFLIFIYYYINRLPDEQLSTIISICNSNIISYEIMKQKIDSTINYPRNNLDIEDYNNIFPLLRKNELRHNCKNINKISFYFFEKIFKYDIDGFNYEELIIKSKNYFKDRDMLSYIYLAINNIGNIKNNKSEEYALFLDDFVSKSSLNITRKSNLKYFIAEELKKISRPASNNTRPTTRYNDYHKRSKSEDSSAVKTELFKLPKKYDHAKERTDTSLDAKSKNENSNKNLLNDKIYATQIESFKSENIFTNENKFIFENNHYIILKTYIGELGQGQFGKVYKYKTIDDKEVAVKCYSITKIKYEYNQIFNNEISNNYKLQEHCKDYVMNIYGIALFSENLRFNSNQICFGYELLSIKLDNNLPTNPKFNNKNITLQLLKGLKCMHSQRILHRDIKPDNIMLTENGTVKYIDFGFSVKVTDITKFEKLEDDVGSPIYMSRISFMKYYSEYSDIYSLCITIYNFITKKYLPFFKGIKTENDLTTKLSTTCINVDNSFVLHEILNNCFKYQFEYYQKYFKNNANYRNTEPSYYSLDAVIPKVEALIF